MAYYPQYYPQQPYPYQPPMMDNLAQLRSAQYQPAQNMQQPPQPAPQQSGQSMLWVSGQQEAAGYPMAPNSAVALWDSTAPVIYLKQADASGKPTMQVFDLVERANTTRTAPAAPQEPPVRYATQDDLDALAARVDALSAKEITQVRPTNKKPAKEDAE